MATTTNQYAQNVDALASYLQARGIDRGAATGKLLGLVSDPPAEHRRFEGRLAIPYLTPGGPVAFKFRCVQDHDCNEVNCQRYDSPSGQTVRLYNAGSLVNGGEVAAVVEGEFKAIVVEQAFGIPAVSSSAGQWLPHWSRCLADYDKVIVIADPDDAGVKHAKDRVMKSLGQQGRLFVPPAKIDDWILSDGAEAVAERIGL